MSDYKYPSQLAERFQIRMPDGLRDRIRVSADENNRSMNAEIIARLERSFEIPAKGVPFISEEASGILDALMKRLDLLETQIADAAREARK